MWRFNSKPATPSSREEAIVRFTIEIPDELINTGHRSSATLGAQTLVGAADVVLSGGPAPSEFGGVAAAALATQDLSAGAAEQYVADSESGPAALQGLDGGPAPG
jgi:hypothetical protein